MCEAEISVPRTRHSHPLSGVAYCLGEMKNTAKANRIAGCPLLVHKSQLVIFIAFSKHKDSLIFKFFQIIGGYAGLEYRLLR